MSYGAVPAEVRIEFEILYARSSVIQTRHKNPMLARSWRPWHPPPLADPRDVPLGLHHIEMGGSRYVTFVSFATLEAYLRCDRAHYFPTTLNKSVLAILRAPKRNQQVLPRNEMVELLVLIIHGVPIPWRDQSHVHAQAVYLFRIGTKIRRRFVREHRNATTDALYLRFPSLARSFLDELVGITYMYIRCPCLYCAHDIGWTRGVQIPFVRRCLTPAAIPTFPTATIFQQCL